LSITPARIVSDFSTSEGVLVAEIDGKMLERLVQAAIASESGMAFSGLSVEVLEGGKVKILPWGGNFVAENLYKIAVNERFPEQKSELFDLSAEKKLKIFNDIRRVFINGLRARNGQVELKRALY
jgi:hypothetical protein